MGRGGAKHFSKWKLNDKHILTVLVKGVGTFSSSKEGPREEAKSKHPTEFPEHVLSF